jgi:hypothetical protein
MAKGQHYVLLRKVEIKIRRHDTQHNDISNNNTLRHDI